MGVPLLIAGAGGFIWEEVASEGKVYKMVANIGNTAKAEFDGLVNDRLAQGHLIVKTNEINGKQLAYDHTKGECFALTEGGMTGRQHVYQLSMDAAGAPTYTGKKYFTGSAGTRMPGDGWVEGILQDGSGTVDNTGFKADPFTKVLSELMGKAKEAVALKQSAFDSFVKTGQGLELPAPPEREKTIAVVEKFLKVSQISGKGLTPEQKYMGFYDFCTTGGHGVLTKYEIDELSKIEPDFIKKYNERFSADIKPDTGAAAAALNATALPGTTATTPGAGNTPGNNQTPPADDGWLAQIERMSPMKKLLIGIAALVLGPMAGQILGMFGMGKFSGMAGSLAKGGGGLLAIQGAGELMHKDPIGWVKSFFSDDTVDKKPNTPPAPPPAATPSNGTYPLASLTAPLKHRTQLKPVEPSLPN